jgi:hypothetical protein
MSAFVEGVEAARSIFSFLARAATFLSAAV